MGTAFEPEGPQVPVQDGRADAVPVLADCGEHLHVAFLETVPPLYLPVPDETDDGVMRLLLRCGADHHEVGTVRIPVLRGESLVDAFRRVHDGRALRLPVRRREDGHRETAGFDHVTEHRAGTDGRKLVDIAHEDDLHGFRNGIQEALHQLDVHHRALVDDERPALERVVRPAGEGPVLVLEEPVQRGGVTVRRLRGPLRAASRRTGEKDLAALGLQLGDDGVRRQRLPCAGAARDDAYAVRGDHLHGVALALVVLDVEADHRGYLPLDLAETDGTAEDVPPAPVVRRQVDEGLRDAALRTVEIRAVDHVLRPADLRPVLLQHPLYLPADRLLRDGKPAGHAGDQRVHVHADASGLHGTVHRVEDTRLQTLPPVGGKAGGPRYPVRVLEGGALHTAHDHVGVPAYFHALPAEDVEYRPRTVLVDAERLEGGVYLPEIRPRTHGPHHVGYRPGGEPPHPAHRPGVGLEDPHGVVTEGVVYLHRIVQRKPLDGRHELAGDLVPPRRGCHLVRGDVEHRAAVPVQEGPPGLERHPYLHVREESDEALVARVGLDVQLLGPVRPGYRDGDHLARPHRLLRPRDGGPDGFLHRDALRPVDPELLAETAVLVVFPEERQFVAFLHVLPYPVSDDADLGAILRAEDAVTPSGIRGRADVDDRAADLIGLPLPLGFLELAETGKRKHARVEESSPASAGERTVQADPPVDLDGPLHVVHPDVHQMVTVGHDPKRDGVLPVVRLPFGDGFDTSVNVRHDVVTVFPAPYLCDLMQIIAK